MTRWAQLPLGDNAWLSVDSPTEPSFEQWRRVGKIAALMVEMLTEQDPDPWLHDEHELIARVARKPASAPNEIAELRHCDCGTYLGRHIDGYAEGSES